MALLYFLEKCRNVTEEKARELGLKGLISKVQSRECFKGPGGPGGSVFGEKDSGAAVRMDLDKQTWHDCGNGLWVGFDSGDKPGPNHLSRPKMIPGQLLELWDGNQWQIPMIREWRVSDGEGPRIRYTTNLPRTLAKNASDGWVHGEVVPAYREVWDRTADAFEWIFGRLSEDSEASMSDQEAVDFAVQILNVNYRVNADAISALGILDFDLAGKIVRIAIGADSFEAALKNVASRGDAETSTSDSGAARQMQDEQTSTPIAQPAAN